MPHHKSCKKRMKQAEVRRTRNRAYRSELRSAVRDLRAEPGAENAETRYREVVTLLDRAASRGLIHKKTADRSKGRLAKLIQKPA